MGGLYWIECAASVITIFNILLILRVVFGVQFYEKPWCYCILGAGQFLLWGLVGNVFKPDWQYFTIEQLVFCLFCAVLMSKTQKRKTFLLCVPAFCLEIQWTNVLLVLDGLLPSEKYVLRLGEIERGPFGWLGWLAEGVLFLLLVLLASRRSQRNMNASETVFVILFCILCPYLKANSENFFYKLTWCVAVIFLNIAVFYGINHRKSGRYYQDVAQNYKQQFDEEYRWFKDYKQEQKEIAGFRHDWNNHLILLSAFFERGEYEKAREYFHALAEKYRSGGGILTGNEILDIILNAKAERFRQGGIEVSCGRGLEALGFMEPVDCCILFSNLIDNAVEANEKCRGQRYIRIAVSENAGNLLLSIENRWNGEGGPEDGHLTSTKEDAKTHGIGTRNAFAIVRKYHGEYRLETQDDRFAVRIIFPVPR